MKRSERDEYNYIKRTLKARHFGAGANLSVERAGGIEYKQAVNSLYESLGFRPCAVKTDPHRFDDQERIIYIWSEGRELLLTEAEREEIRLALTT